MELRRDLENCRKEAKQSVEQENMASFQNQLLIDMVSGNQQQDRAYVFVPASDVTSVYHRFRRICFSFFFIASWRHHSEVSHHSPKVSSLDYIAATCLPACPKCTLPT